jgi:hypothetical protein
LSGIPCLLSTDDTFARPPQSEGTPKDRALISTAAR